jgi:anti-anti-sigma regulatory factor
MANGHIHMTKNVNGVKALKITGAFTKDTIPDLQKICYSFAKDQLTKGVLLDFQEVTEIDTAAFACIIGFIKDHIPQGVKIGVINLKTQEKMLAELLKVDKVIHEFQNESEAIDALSGK